MTAVYQEPLRIDTNPRVVICEGMKAVLPLAVLMALLSAARAETPAKDSVIPGIWVLPGIYLKEVRDVKVVNPVTVSFSHSGGKSTVRFDKIEEKFRILFGYDKAKADAYEADLAAKEAEKKRILAEMAEKQKLLAEKLAERDKLDKEIAETKQKKREAIFAAEMRRQLGDKLAYIDAYGYDLGNYLYSQSLKEKRERDLKNAAAAKFQKESR